jgi:hypothetical protein
MYNHGRTCITLLSADSKSEVMFALKNERLNPLTVITVAGTQSLRVNMLAGTLPSVSCTVMGDIGKFGTMGCLGATASLPFHCLLRKIKQWFRL